MIVTSLPTFVQPPVVVTTTASPELGAHGKGTPSSWLALAWSP
ncbi:MAG: hypothetical protein R3E61_04535 [Pseudomonadales bacterium]